MCHFLYNDEYLLAIEASHLCKNKELITEETIDKLKSFKFIKNYNLAGIC